MWIHVSTSTDINSRESKTKTKNVPEESRKEFLYKLRKWRGFQATTQGKKWQKIDKSACEQWKK